MCNITFEYLPIIKSVSTRRGKWDLQVHPGFTVVRYAKIIDGTLTSGGGGSFSGTGQRLGKSTRRGGLFGNNTNNEVPTVNPAVAAAMDYRYGKNAAKAVGKVARTNTHYFFLLSVHSDSVTSELIRVLRKS